MSVQQTYFDFDEAGPEEPKASDRREYQEACRGLRESFARHKQIIAHGTSDPFWPDGVNANLVRNHIIFFKERLKEMNHRFGFRLPAEYELPAPDEIDPNYMAPGSKACSAGILNRERDISEAGASSSLTCRLS